MEETAGFSSIGKFEARKLIADFDALLIDRYGVNMTDARVSRHEALTAIAAEGSAAKAVDSLGRARGLKAAA